MFTLPKGWFPLALTALLCGNAGAQAAQVTTTTTVRVVRPEGAMLWLGLGTEFYFLPGVSLGLSVPLVNTQGFSVSLRGVLDGVIIPLPDASVPLPIPFVNADLLFSSVEPGVKVYGGPSVGTLLGSTWLLGGVLGARNEFQGASWGWFAEAKVRAVLDSTGASAFPTSMGARLGFTHRF